MTLKLGHFCDDPPPQKKKPHNLHTPNNFHFSEKPKNIEIQNFEPLKIVGAYVCVKISEYPPPPPPPWTSARQLNAIRMTFCWRADGGLHCVLAE